MTLLAVQQQLMPCHCYRMTLSPLSYKTVLLFLLPLVDRWISIFCYAVAATVTARCAITASMLTVTMQLRILASVIAGQLLPFKYYLCACCLGAVLPTQLPLIFASQCCCCFFSISGLLPLFWLPVAFVAASWLLLLQISILMSLPLPSSHWLAHMAVIAFISSRCCSFFCYRRLIVATVVCSCHGWLAVAIVASQISFISCCGCCHHCLSCSQHGHHSVCQHQLVLLLFVNTSCLLRLCQLLLLFLIAASCLLPLFWPPVTVAAFVAPDLLLLWLFTVWFFFVWMYSFCFCGCCHHWLRFCPYDSPCFCQLLFVTTG